MDLKKTFLDKGILKRLKTSEQPDYELIHASDAFSHPTNLIPGLGGVSGGRVLLGTKATVQATSLVHREAPLVRSTAAHDVPSFIQSMGKYAGAIHATADGTVKEVTSEHIKIGDKAYELYDNHNIGRKSFLHNDPAVKVGDHVKAGQLIATSNYTDKKGNLALGINLTTAVMPYRSLNFEDAFVVSESAAKKLEASQIIKIQLSRKFGTDIGKNKFISLFPNKYNNAQISKLDADGVAKVGSKMLPGDPVIVAFAPRTMQSTEVQLGKLSKAMRHAFNDQSDTWDYEHEGIVTDVSKTDDLVTVNVKTVRGFAIGDKLSNGFGAKGICAAVLADSQMPSLNGKPVDMILNSMSITSRVAPALAVTMAMGKFAQKTGKIKKMVPFVNGSAIGKSIEELKKHDIKDVEELYDPHTGKNISALVGPLYTSRLAHIAEDKISERGQGLAYSWDRQPTKAPGESAKRIGNLGTTALLSHNAKNVLEDISTIRATKNDDYWRRLKMGLPLPAAKVPFIFDKFISSLRGSGINVEKTGDTFQVMPQTDKDTLSLSAGPINSAATFKIKKDMLEPEVGGLFDPAKVGVLGERYNHIDLNMAIPNPISEEYIRKLLKVTQKQFDDMVVNGDIAKRLKEINIDTKIQELEAYLKSKKKTDRETSVKLLSFLRLLKQKNITLPELMISKVPIIPAQYRPIAMQGDLILPSGVNLLYKDLILHNNSLHKLEGVPEELQHKAKLEQYHAVKAVYGLADPITTKSQEKGIKGLLASSLGLQGGSAKGSMFQANVVNKPMDLVGRGVLAGNVSLGLDEASVPQDIIWKTYGPFVMRRLVRKGIPATTAFDYVDSRNVVAKQALQEELKERPAIISRDPALHKFNLTGFYLKPNADPKDFSIKMNPLVYKAFNADQDGDALNVSVPAGDKAKHDVITKMLPSQNLLSPRNFAPVYTPSNEAALGLYQSSSENNKNKPIKFKTVKDVEAAFNAGKVNIGDAIELG